ncbi:LLM class oxidoreductase [Pseudomonas sp. nanlin1]|uniref:LLM class oxidoreductase n=1 Tax=Pseudomonas sp. nanlin1 TaxID=3040605 RepID=UPI003890C2EC
MNQPTPRSTLPDDLQRHHGFARVFAPGKLTFGFIAPLEGYPDSPGPTMVEHERMARRVDQAGFSSIWLRDVPFYDPGFGDVGQQFDPMVYAAFLAAVTRTIAIGTAGIVLPLRDPLIVAKQVASVDQLLGGRFVLGLASGDRPAEYPAFGSDFENRAARFREAFAIVQRTLGSPWPRFASQYYGTMDGHLDLVPKPAAVRVPQVVVGFAGQSLEWIATQADGIISYMADPARTADMVKQWQALGNPEVFRPYGYGTFFDLCQDPDAPLQPGRVLRAGRNALIELWARQQEQGVAHVALNLKPLSRPAEAVIDEMAEYILPHFPSHTPLT